jgi:hypothetical protein
VGLAPLPCSSSWARHSEQQDPHTPCFLHQSGVHWRARTQTTVRPQRLTAPPCSYMNALCCTGFWLAFLISVIGNIGYTDGEVDGINANNVPATQRLQTPALIGWLWLAVMFTFSPRFPDVWVTVWALLLRVPVLFSEYSPASPSSPAVWSSNVSALSIALAGFVVIAIRFKLIITCLREVRKHRWVATTSCAVQTFSSLTLACITRIKHAAAWQSKGFTSPDCEQQLTRLGRIVEELELSIPTGTVARQFKLRSSDEFGGNHGHGRQSPAGAKPRRTNSRPSSANSQTTTVSADSHTYHNDDTPTSLPVLSAIIQQLHAVADPRALLSSVPSQRLVSRRGIEPTLAAAGKTDILFKYPRSNDQIPMRRIKQTYYLNTPVQTIKSRCVE